MVSPSTGAVGLVHFPFSDLSAAKLRPALVLAKSSFNDWILCQVTSNPYSDPLAVEIRDADFAAGSLKRASFARPNKLFTASETLISAEIGKMREDAFKLIIDKTISIFQASHIK